MADVFPHDTPPAPVVHSFNECLARSQSYADEPWWLDVYRRAFPNLASAVTIRDDGWAQRGGIDRLISLTSGKTITVDEKVREKDYGDILLERFSDERRKTPGWMETPLACDYIAYAVAPTRTCYLLPFQTLWRAWQLNGQSWIAQYQPIRARNPGYVTLSVAVPVAVLMRALTDAMTVHWRLA
jgi:hypothetical protein